MAPIVDCVFCDRLRLGDFVAENDLAVAFRDAFPLSARALPRCATTARGQIFFALTPEEQAAVWALVVPVRGHIEADRLPDGYNIGINVGEAAGQTVAHAHLHVIPRYRGDVADPRGGIRSVIPANARYWETR